jgi:hypothetical protein
MDRHLSSDIEFASPSLCSILRGAGTLTPLILAAYEMSQRYGGNAELLERPAGQSFNPRIARIAELSMQAGLKSESELAAIILGASQAPVQLAGELETMPVQNHTLLSSALVAAQQMMDVPGSVLNQAIALDNLRRAHLLELDRRSLVVAAAQAVIDAAIESALKPVLFKAISRYKTQ